MKLISCLCPKLLENCSSGTHTKPTELIKSTDTIGLTQSIQKSEKFKVFNKKNTQVSRLLKYQQYIRIVALEKKANSC